MIASPPSPALALAPSCRVNCARKRGRNSEFAFSGQGGRGGFQLHRTFRAKKGRRLRSFRPGRNWLISRSRTPSSPLSCPPPFIASSPPKTHSVAKLLNYGPLSQVGGQKVGGGSFSVHLSRHHTCSPASFSRGSNWNLVGGGEGGG